MKDVDINIYTKFQGHRDGLDARHPSKPSQVTSPKLHPEGPRGDPCPPEDADAATFQELAETIQMMQNRLKYIDSAKQKHERQIDSTMKRANNFAMARALADELSRKVVESRKREESLKSALRSKAAELNTNNKRALLEKTAKLRDEKLRQTELAKQEKLELERRARQAQEEDLMAKKSKVLKVKNEKMILTSGRMSEVEKLSRRGSMLNLDIGSHLRDRENVRRMNHSIHENRGGVTALHLTHTRNGLLANR